MKVLQMVNFETVVHKNAINKNANEELVSLFEL